MDEPTYDVEPTYKEKQPNEAAANRNLGRR